jgi:predicted metal-dependent hydrolase
MAQTQDPLILLLTEDLMFGTRLQDTIRAAGYRCQVIEKPAQLEAEGQVAGRPIPLTEPLTGADAGLMRSLASLQPALVFVDLTASGIPWRRWIQIMKTSASSRRIPIVAFGPHVDEDNMQLAKQAGADRAVPRGLIAKKLIELVEEYARQIDWANLETSCQQDLSDLARKGIELHNAGEYFEAHEFLEEAWLAEPGEAGFLYRALLQVTVTHLHIQRGNQRGALKMMLRLRQWLDPLPDRCRGVRVDQLRQSVDSLRQALLKLPPDSLDQLDRSLLGPFPLTDDD